MFQSNFDDVSAEAWNRPMDCDVECFDCDGWKALTKYIFNLASSFSAVLSK